MITWPDGTPLISDEEKTRRVNAALKGEGERIDNPEHPYHGYFRIDVGLYLDPNGDMHWNVPELLEKAGIPVTRENRERFTARIARLLLAVDPSPVIVRKEIDDGSLN